MRLIILFCSALLFIACKNQERSQEHQHSTTQASTKTSLSPLTSTMVSFDKAHIHIEYSAPSVRERIIFGGLLAYGQLWQAGAHRATWMETTNDLLIDGKELKAGKYGIFAIPGKEEWTLILNTRWDQHGKDEYNQEEDVIRISLTPESTDELVETLNYQIIQKDASKGSLFLAWEHTRVGFDFEVVE